MYEELGFVSVSEDEPFIQALKLMYEFSLEFISVVDSKSLEIKGLLFATDIVYVLRKKNYLQILDTNAGLIVKQLNSLNMPLLDYLPHQHEEHEAQRTTQQIFDDVSQQGIDPKYSIAESDGGYPHSELKVDFSDLGVSVAAGLGSYEISNQGGTLGLNSTTATSRRNKEQSKVQEEKKQRDIPGFFRVRKLGPNDSLVDLVSKIFQSEEKLLVGLTESGHIRTSLSLGDLFEYMFRSAS